LDAGLVLAELAFVCAASGAVFAVVVVFAGAAFFGAALLVAAFLGAAFFAGAFFGLSLDEKIPAMLSMMDITNPPMLKPTINAEVG
jgi:hypothetical protein